MDIDKIAYRAWHKKEKKMFNVSCINIEYGIVESFKYRVPVLNITCDIRNVILMLWTGIYSKNNKKIFEDDYIKFNKNIIGRIVYVNQNFSINQLTKNNSFYKNFGKEFNKNWENLEIIGNFWENREEINKLINKINNEY